MENKKEIDYINPKHYEILGVEAIDILEKVLTPEEFWGYLKGNVLKYRFRAGKKPNQPAARDLKKAN